MQFSTIKQQILFWGSASLIAVVTATFSFSYFNSNNLSNEIQTLVLKDTESAIKQRLSLSANVEAQYIASTFNKAMSITTGLAASFGNETPVISREAVNVMLQNTLEKNKDILSIYTGWEVNQFDGQDAVNTDMPHSQASGVFAPYWNRSANGTVALQALGNFYATNLSAAGFRASEWYLCPMESKTACVTDPSSFNVQGVQTLLSSFVAPVIRDGQFIGMFGVDYSLNFLQSLAQDTAQRLFSGQSQVLIISSAGVIAADSKQADNIGKKLNSIAIKNLLSKRLIDETVTVENDFLTSKQFNATGVTQQWEVIIITPRNVALASTKPFIKAVDNGFSTNLKSQLGIAVLTSILGIILMWIAAQSISKPIRYLVDKVRQLTQSGGDLTQSLNIQRHDETGQLAEYLNIFIANVREVVADVAVTSKHLNTSAKITANAADQGLLKIAEQQLEIEQVATATNEMSSTAHSVSDSAQVTAQAVSETQKAVNNGQLVVEANADGLRSLSQNVSHATQVVAELESRSEGIVAILEVIRNISAQTNLLALNAAIEAARAGEQGRGFAVVADEVRNLATQTATSTDEIQVVIDSLRDYSRQAVEAMNTSGSLTDSCLGHATNAVDALKQINEQSCRIQDMAHQIASAAEEQAAVTEEVNRNIVAISNVAVSIAEGAKTSQQESANVAQYTADVSNKINNFQY